MGDWGSPSASQTINFSLSLSSYLLSPLSLNFLPKAYRILYFDFVRLYILHTTINAGAMVVISDHKHPLVLIRSDNNDWKCDGCSKEGDVDRYNCSTCDFDVCKECLENSGLSVKPSSGPHYFSGHHHELQERHRGWFSWAVYRLQCDYCDEKISGAAFSCKEQKCDYDICPTCWSKEIGATGPIDEVKSKEAKIKFDQENSSKADGDSASSEPAALEQGSPKKEGAKGAKLWKIQENNQSMLLKGFSGLQTADIEKSIRNRLRIPLGVEIILQDGAGYDVPLHPNMPSGTYSITRVTRS